MKRMIVMLEKLHKKRKRRDQRIIIRVLYRLYNCSIYEENIALDFQPPKKKKEIKKKKKKSSKGDAIYSRWM